MRTIWLGLALLPYLGLAAADAWVHERGRRVPRVEAAIHGVLAVALAAFLYLAFTGSTAAASAALGCFVVALAADELRFHRGIARHERRLHVASWVALALFVAAWRAVDPA